MSQVSPAAPRTAPQLLRDRDFGLFVLGKMLSSCGTWIQNIGAAVLMYSLTRSAFMVGAVSAVQFAGPVLLAVWAGALTDRYDRKRLLMLGRCLSTGPAIAMALLIASRGVDGFGGPGVLLAGVFVMGLGLALSAPPMLALVPALVEHTDLEQALAISTSPPSVARAVGPVVGATLLLAGGPALTFFAAGLAHATFVVVLLFIRPRPQERPQRRARPLGGVRYLLKDPTSGLLMLGVAALGLGADPVLTLTPPLVDRLGGGEELVGILVTSFGVGSVTIVFGIRILRRFVSLRRLGVMGFWVLGAGLLVAAVAPGPGAAMAGLFVAGIGFMTSTVSLNTRLQRRVPERLRGRVMALWGLAFLGSRPFGAMVNGTIADATSVNVAFAVAGLVTLLASLLARVREGEPFEATVGRAGGTAGPPI